MSGIDHIYFSWYNLDMILLLLLYNLCLAGEPEDKAIEAAYIQSGLKHYSDGTLSYLNNNYINRSSVLRTGSGMYLIYRNRCVRFEIGNVKNEIGLDSLRVEWVIKI